MAAKTEDIAKTKDIKHTDISFIDNGKAKNVVKVKTDVARVINASKKSDEAHKEEY